MKGFFLELGGIDKAIFDRVKDTKKYLLTGVGVVVLILFILTFFSTSYLLTFLVKDTLIDCIIAALYATVVMNFYRFTLCSTIWRIVDYKKADQIKNPNLLTTIIRLATCSFFFVLVSKPIELWLFYGKIQSHSKAIAPKNLYKSFSILHEYYPFTWLITLIILAFFLFPIYFRSYSKKWGNYEYELLHNYILLTTISKNYTRFVECYNDVFEKKGLNVKYRNYFENPPFNTRLLDSIIVNTKGKPLQEGTNQDFYNSLDEMQLKS
ncbi:MAG TPA: DUF4407 domain-containing protein [Ferruginibacter sp.]|nr:DUF4407 domain-containing protein [Ferruginibacter sp.]